ncbi:MAG: hypothetical protein H6765_03875 [Candidatus Peribacteria bacterium]|nr:MAG: hypothetical protein H6765_03875 [Candidatus Peribacteria bacterium]
MVKGSQGNYMPNNLITEAEALTVTIRSVMGMQDETGTPWWKEYYEIGKWLNIIDNEGVYDLDTPITREKAGTWLYRASQVESDEVQTEGTEELETILKDIFGDDFFAQ